MAPKIQNARQTKGTVNLITLTARRIRLDAFAKGLRFFATTCLAVKPFLLKFLFSTIIQNFRLRISLELTAALLPCCKMAIFDP